MSDSGPVAPECPNCGSALQLNPDNTCVWCHAYIEQPKAVPQNLLGGVIQIIPHGTLTGHGPAIDFGNYNNFPSPFNDLLRWLDGLRGQPAAKELAANQWLDKDFATTISKTVNIVGQANGGSRGVQLWLGPGAIFLTDLVWSMASYPGTDPSWTSQARIMVGELHKAQKHDRRGRSDREISVFIGKTLGPWVLAHQPKI